MPGAVQVTRRVWRAGLWSQLRYKVERGGESFETPVVISPAERPLTAENYLRVVGLIYLFIGIFIFIRRWNAPRAVHFYVFCLVSFILYSFHYSGKLDNFDYEVYWAGVVARLLAPALLLHFALVFPERAQSSLKEFAKLSFVYGPPLLLLLAHLNVAMQALGFMMLAILIPVGARSAAEQNGAADEPVPAHHTQPPAGEPPQTMMEPRTGAREMRRWDDATSYGTPN